MKSKRYVSKLSETEFFIDGDVKIGYVQMNDNLKNNIILLPIKDLFEFIEWYKKQLRLIT